MNRTRTKQITFRVSEKEYEQLQEKIKQSGLNQQAYLVQSALGKSISNYRDVIPELKRIGNNINQVARKCNENGTATSEDTERMGEELRKIWQLLKP